MDSFSADDYSLALSFAEEDNRTFKSSFVFLADYYEVLSPHLHLLIQYYFKTDSYFVKWIKTAVCFTATFPSGRIYWPSYCFILCDDLYLPLFSHWTL